MNAVSDKPTPVAGQPSGGNRPASPCVRTCTLDDANVCIGCGRTLDEIVAWSKLTADEQRAVLDRLPARRP